MPIDSYQLVLHHFPLPDACIPSNCLDSSCSLMSLSAYRLDYTGYPLGLVVGSMVGELRAGLKLWVFELQRRVSAQYHQLVQQFLIVDDDWGCGCACLICALAVFLKVGKSSWAFKGSVTHVKINPCRSFHTKLCCTTSHFLLRVLPLSVFPESNLFCLRFCTLLEGYVSPSHFVSLSCSICTVPQICLYRIRGAPIGLVWEWSSPSGLLASSFWTTFDKGP